MNNPIDNIKNMLGSLTPEQLVKQMVQNSHNPLLTDLVNKLQAGDTKAVETFARNVMKEQGRDFDAEFEEFVKNFK